MRDIKGWWDYGKGFTENNTVKYCNDISCQMGNYQVIRDFVLNFYDSVGYDEWKEKFRYEYLN